MKRSAPLLRKTPLARGTTRLRYRTPKRAAQERDYVKKARAFLVAHPNCKPCEDGTALFGVQDIGHGSTMSRKVLPATQVHHMGRRYGKWLLDERFFLPCCRHHHDLIEGNGDWARERGYLLTPEQRRLLQPAN